MSDLTIHEVDPNKEAVATRHKEEWRLFRTAVLAPAADSHDPEAANFARSIAQAIKTAQEGERKAWDMHGGESDDGEVIYKWEEAEAK